MRKMTYVIAPALAALAINACGGGAGTNGTGTETATGTTTASGTATSTVTGTEVTTGTETTTNTATGTGTGTGTGTTSNVTPEPTNAYKNSDADPQLTNVGILSPNYLPKSGSPALTGGAVPPNDGFFDTSATYRGAMGTVDWTAGWTTVAFTAKDAANTVDVAPVGSATDVRITTNTTWTKDKTYVLKAHVFVENGATLTIQPGTLVLGDALSSLVITKDGKLDAQGTAAEPILFSSKKAFTSGQTPAAGDWGGVVMLGKATINVSGGSTKVEGFANTIPGIDFGGTDDAHDCGKLHYARIDYAGYVLATDKELNSLTLGACGTNTSVHHIMTRLGADDGVEVFGGTVNLKHILVFRPDDDGLDWDYGWTGKAQNLIVHQDAVVGDKGIEADNNGSLNSATPMSKPTIYNMTIIGGGLQATRAQSGMHLRRGTAGNLFNFVVTGFNTNLVDVDSTVSATNAQTADALSIKNSVLHGIWRTETQGTSTDNDGNFNEQGWFFKP